MGISARVHMTAWLGPLVYQVFSLVQRNKPLGWPEEGGTQDPPQSSAHWSLSSPGIFIRGSLPIHRKAWCLENPKSALVLSLLYQDISENHFPQFSPFSCGYMNNSFNYTAFYNLLFWVPCDQLTRSCSPKLEPLVLCSCKRHTILVLCFSAARIEELL